jgi:hypothetical protein
MKQQKRLETVKMAEENLKRKASETLQKRALLNTRSEKALELHRQRALERAYKHKLEEEDRLEHITRQKRMDEMHRQRIMARIENDTNRVAVRKAKKQELLDQRRHMREQAVKQQSAILDTFEGLKQNIGKGIDLE